jgi:8-oxo-dGTP pyrophosphatase MutT (NUDIX family)
MSEMLEVYDLKGNLLRLEERSRYYKKIKEEYSKKGKIKTQVRGIRLLLMNSQGRIYLQKRSKHKEGNPGLYDKTIGGHSSAGESQNLTVIRECAEELGFPAAVLSSEEFDKATKVTDLNIIGIFKSVDHINNFKSIRTSKNKKMFTQPWSSSFYIGYYDGAIRFADGESIGIEVFSLKELKQELKENPDKFTEDIKFMIKKYEKYLKPIRK